MKPKLRLFILPVLVWAGFFALPITQTGCSTPVDARHAQYATLKAVGDAADGVVATSAHLYASGVISADQANSIKTLFDTKFHPAYILAMNAAHTDLSTDVPQNLIAIAGQLAALLQTYQNK